MSKPKKQQTRARRGSRNAHSALKTPSFSICPKCKKTVVPHRVCQFCGFYKGKEIIKKKTKIEKTKEKEK